VSDQLTLTIRPALIDGIAQRVVELLRHDRRLETDEQRTSPWLTFTQACEYLGFSRDTLYKLTAARAIPSRKKQGGQGLRFHRDELDAWMGTQYPRLDRLP
jgi:excisionase family DNA binding protein